jgi:SAM-dependent methyltransferase
VAILGVALGRLDVAPQRVLDLGTGTGVGARFLAERYPAAEVVGVDLAPAMIAKAQELLPAELAGGVRFEVADATALPFGDGSFDLIVLLNMIPFFDELARVAAPRGAIVIAFGAGPETPIYVPAETLEDRLGKAGFERIEHVEASGGTASFANRDPGPPGDPVLGTPTGQAIGEIRACLCRKCAEFAASRAASAIIPPWPTCSSSSSPTCARWSSCRASASSRSSARGRR